MPPPAKGPFLDGSRGGTPLAERVWERQRLSQDEPPYPVARAAAVAAARRVGFASSDQRW
jgi:hypothetical protein